MRRMAPKKKSKLTPLGKAIAAAKALLDFRDGKLDTKQVGLILREQIGLQWSVITAAQYLTGKEALEALTPLPKDWVDGAWTRERMFEAIVFANLFCAQAHPSGSSLSAGSMVGSFKPEGEIGKLLAEFQARTDGVEREKKAT